VLQDPSGLSGLRPVRVASVREARLTVTIRVLDRHVPDHSRVPAADDLHGRALLATFPGRRASGWRGRAARHGDLGPRPRVGRYDLGGGHHQPVRRGVGPVEVPQRLASREAEPRLNDPLGSLEVVGRQRGGEGLVRCAIEDLPGLDRDLLEPGARGLLPGLPRRLGATTYQQITRSTRVTSRPTSTRATTTESVYCPGPTWICSAGRSSVRSAPRSSSSSSGIHQPPLGTIGPAQGRRIGRRFGRGLRVLVRARRGGHPLGTAVCRLIRRPPNLH
jgi:hypothetical protein